VNLLNPEVSELLAGLPYASGHGASPGRVDGGIIYYALAAVQRAQVCVCLGSGGGFVPCLMRQAQRDLELADSETYLVDAILPEAGFGGPDIPGGWMDPKGTFGRFYTDIIVLSCLTEEAGRGFFAKNRVQIDFLHIDADHSFQSALGDFNTYLPLLSPRAIVTFHDTNTDDLQRVLTHVQEVQTEFQLFDLPDFGTGLAILRRTQKGTW
jgi:hypothetical protein